VTKIGESYEFGDIVIYQCAKQHVLTGGGLEMLWLRCGSGATWNGTAPACERKYSYSLDDSPSRRTVVELYIRLVNSLFI